MKESSILLLLTLVFAVIGFNPYLQKAHKHSYWECWLNGKYTKITVIRGEVFKAIILTETLGTLLLHGGEKVDQSGNVTSLFGSIERKGETIAVGTFFIEKTKLDKTLVGEINIIQENKLYTIILSPLD